ncbi:hormogonium polysaccharide biosynthesis protein HpsA [Trichothermofontia sichuanensis B231]|uniref:hormogonium polysaccharide biosynthesis protein HpsA n=1 Tax=Trichothermofontia sichuanensis TaxID=3045816 RepID=UPI002247FB79|nr:hormogonium polysaccharide biosynthesis protein HpsA [Trichothermofontia sichuanensis]UZQ54705.1 hormogonium polysaccharide biosynthesis protein HpsA [Trichothermofontia sichuanensis B231]
MSNRNSRKSLSPAQPQEIRQQHWLLRFWLIHYRASTASSRSPVATSSGFVLPTMIFVLLATVMVMGAMIFRSYNRTTQVSGARQQATIANAATPAIERAKAKLEYMFTKDARLPSGRIRDDQIAGILLNNGQGGTAIDPVDLYKLPDETWVTEQQLNLDFNQDGTINNDQRVPLWRFNDPATNSTIVYGIFFNVARRNGTTLVTSVYADETSNTPAGIAKPNSLIVRNGPIAAAPACGASAGGSGGDILPSDGWFNVGSTGNSKRAFQVMAIAVPQTLTDNNPNNNPPNPAIATLQYQQDREIKPGNTYGAWFRYDLEIFPGPNFNWNGRTYSAGSTFITSNSGFTSYLISSPRSCYYMPVENSEIASGGLFAIGSMRDNNWNANTVTIHLHPGSPVDPVNAANNGYVVVTNANDAVNQTGITPIVLAADPVQMVTRDKTLPRGLADYASKLAGNWSTNILSQRQRVVVNKTICPPYVDDLYRADNRYGPKPTYNRSVQVDGQCQAEPFTEEQGSIATDPELVREQPEPAPNGEPGDPAKVGLDGYWERRAMNEGLRIVVGQRLELGNMHGWQSAANADDPNADPLNPPPANAATGSSMAGREHEQRQWRTLRDNLAAVQAMAVYHTASNTPQFPIACVAATSHPGTQQTIINSTTFTRPQFPDGTFMAATTSTGVPNVYTGFLNGNGTNGWEFNPPGPDGTEAGFRTAIDNPSSPLNKALTNLAYMAGDPYGAFPPRQDSYATPATAAVPNLPVTHPFPTLTMWGDFSNLRRIMNRLNGLQGETNINYNDLSPADKTTLHTAACTIQMLAHNLRIEQDIFTAAGNISGGEWTSSFNSDIKQKLINFTPSGGSAGYGSIIGKRPSDGTVIICKDSNTGNAQWPAPNSSSTDLFFLAGDPGCPLKANFLNPSHPDYFGNYFSKFKLEDWIDALEIMKTYGNATQAATYTKIINGLKQSIVGLAVIRDRRLGFNTTGSITGNISGAYNPTTGIFTVPGTNWGNFPQGTQIKLACDPATLGGNTTITVDDPFAPNLNQEAGQLGWAFIYCGAANPPRYPALYYLFPLQGLDHDHDGLGANDAQPATEPYIGSSYIQHEAINGNSTNIYQAVDPASIALSPRLPANWLLPNTTTATGRINTIVDAYTATGTNTNRYLAFLDKGMFNGREMMGVRVLDLDLDLLRRTTTTGAPFNASLAQSWLSNTGIVYAFREDAVREDAIARPRATGITEFGACNQVYTATGTPELLTDSCRMNAVGASPQDPPIFVGTTSLPNVEPPTYPLYSTLASDRRGISIKPVDFFADPDRRPHGFRLRNGADLRRIPDPPTDFQMRGLSFVSDNPVYIMTDNNEFNAHKSGNTLIEEFTQPLPDTWGFTQFYNNRTTLNSPPFASVNDQWRPTEILADGITILSRTFADGWIAQGIRGMGTSSYRSLNSPINTGQPTTATPPAYGNTAELPWLRENGLFSRDVNMASPIKISRRGFPLYCKRDMNGDGDTIDNVDVPPSSQDNTKSCVELGGQPQEYGREVPDNGPRPANNTNRTFITFATDKSLQSAAANQRVNAMLISGITPSRVWSAYGGMHNFPRFLETWGNLFISGTLMQLSFSNYATAPFDQDSWEPGSDPLSAEYIKYYGAPQRRWGYDVALQYAPATPVSLRMAELTRSRDEFYRELSATDPYVCVLRRAINFPCN